MMAGSRTATQLSMILEKGDPASRRKDAFGLFTRWYPSRAFKPVARAFALARHLYEGKLPGFKRCNTEYHDFSHTLDVLACTSRIIDGRNIHLGPIDEELCCDLLVAALLHDAGYIQEAGDDAGTGAKYTKVHVERSMRFAMRAAKAIGIGAERATRVGRLIKATDLQADFDAIPYLDEQERGAGALLVTADLLGQMADRAYLEKLLFLYYEFKEAGFGGYDTEFDILKRTFDFYDSTRLRLRSLYMHSYEYLVPHFQARYGVEANLYMDAVERQIDYLREIIADDSTNFRKKLKRMDLEKVTAVHAS